MSAQSALSFSLPETLLRRTSSGRPVRPRSSLYGPPGEICAVLQRAISDSDRLIRIKRAGQGSLGLLLQAAFIAAHEDQEGEEGKDSQHDRYDPHWPRQPIHALAP